MFVFKNYGFIHISHNSFQKHVENMDELRYVFRVANSRGNNEANSIQNGDESENKD